MTEGWPISQYQGAWGDLLDPDVVHDYVYEGDDD